MIKLTAYRGRHPRRFEILTQTPTLVQYKIYDSAHTFTITVYAGGEYFTLREPP